jgi:hypothetical protein
VSKGISSVIVCCFSVVRKTKCQYQQCLHYTLFVGTVFCVEYDSVTVCSDVLVLRALQLLHSYKLLQFVVPNLLLYLCCLYFVFLLHVFCNSLCMSLFHKASRYLYSIYTVQLQFFVCVSAVFIAAS